MVEGCTDCEYVRQERAGIHMTHAGLSQAEADALAAGERCTEHKTVDHGSTESRPTGLKIEVLRYDPHRKQDGEYIGFPRTLAGEFRFGFDGTREEVIAKYRAWLFGEVKAKGRAYHKLTELLGTARGGAGLVLVCLEPEFGEVIRRCMEWMNREELKHGKS